MKNIQSKYRNDEQIGLNAKYLSGGISSWKWEFNESKLYKDISPKELKMLLDSFLNYFISTITTEIIAFGCTRA